VEGYHTIRRHWYCSIQAYFRNLLGQHGARSLTKTLISSTNSPLYSFKWLNEKLVLPLCFRGELARLRLLLELRRPRVAASVCSNKQELVRRSERFLRAVQAKRNRNHTSPSSCRGCGATSTRRDLLRSFPPPYTVVP